MGDLPVGFGMTLAMNTKAMETFSSLGEQKQQEIIARTQQINSKQEMHQYVESLSGIN